MSEGGLGCLFTLIQRMLSAATVPRRMRVHTVSPPVRYFGSSFSEAHPPALLAPVSQVTLSIISEKATSVTYNLHQNPTVAL